MYDMKINHMRIGKFLIAGGLAAGTEYVSFVVLKLFIDELIITQSLSFMCGFVVSFYLQKSWVFRSIGKTYEELPKYLVLAVINLILSNIVMSLLVNTANLEEMIAKILVMAMIACWNYLIFQKIIFKTDQSQKAE